MLAFIAYESQSRISFHSQAITLIQLTLGLLPEILLVSPRPDPEYIRFSLERLEGIQKSKITTFFLSNPNLQYGTFTFTSFCREFGCPDI